MNKIAITLAQNITQKRTAKGWTQYELAEKIGLKRSAYASYEEHRARVPSSVLPMLAMAFGCSIDELFSRK